MPKVMEVQIVHSCPFTGRLPAMFKRVRILPPAKKKSPNAIEVTAQRFECERVERDRFRDTFGSCSSRSRNEPPPISPLDKPFVINIDELVHPEASLKSKHDQTPRVWRCLFSDFVHLPC